LGAGISVGFAQRVLESRGVSRFSDYSRKAAGVVLTGGGAYLLVSLI